MRKLLLIVLVLLLASVTALTGCGGKTEYREITLGSLVARSGDLASLGQASEASLKLAVQDINEYLSDIASSFRVKLIIEDTGADPAAALEKLRNLESKGAKLIIGPQSSAELEATKDYADEKGMILISADSTAPSLAISGDNVFRLAMGDSLQAEALADLMWKGGIRKAVIAHRSDIWGNDLASLIKERFEQRGGIVAERIKYSPAATDFTVDIGSLSTAVSQALNDCGAGAVAVLLLSYEEASDIFIQSQADTVLSSVRWFGSDGITLSPAITGNTKAASFALEVGMVSPICGGGNEGYIELEHRIRAETGSQSSAFAMNAYDAAWLAAITGVITSASDNVFVLKRALLQTANSHTGITGPTSLDNAGDRKYGSFNFWALNEESGTFQWKQVARWKVESGRQGWDDDSDAQVRVSGLIALADSHIRGYVNALKALSVTDEVQSGDWLAMSPLLGKIVQAGVSAAVWYVLPDGSYFTVEGGKQSASLADRTYFPHLMAGNVVTGDLVVSRSTGRKSAIVAVPVMKDGKVVGGLGSSVFLDDMSNTLLRELALPDDTIFYAVTTGNEVVLHSDTANIMADNPRLPKNVVWNASPLTGWRFALGTR